MTYHLPPLSDDDLQRLWIKAGAVEGDERVMSLIAEVRERRANTPPGGLGEGDRNVLGMVVEWVQSRRAEAGRGERPLCDQALMTLDRLLTSTPAASPGGPRARHEVGCHALLSRGGDCDCAAPAPVAAPVAPLTVAAALMLPEVRDGSHVAVAATEHWHIHYRVTDRGWVEHNEVRVGESLNERWWGAAFLGTTEALDRPCTIVPAVPSEGAP